jgi:hypothetical protein
MRKYLVIDEEAVSHTVHDFAIVPFWILLYMRKILFSFLSVHGPSHRMVTEKCYNLYIRKIGSDRCKVLKVDRLLVSNKGRDSEKSVTLTPACLYPWV